MGPQRDRTRFDGTRKLGRLGLPVSPIGLGLAALGRPAYINLGHAEDIGPDHSVAAFRRRADAAPAATHAPRAATPARAAAAPPCAGERPPCSTQPTRRGCATSTPPDPTVAPRSSWPR